MKHYYFAVIILLCSFFACNDKDEFKNRELPSLTEFNIEPISGGAVISYMIPKDPDILYILAEYERNGVKFTEKSSSYKNEITVEGFDTQEKVDVTLYTVNRQGEKSEPSFVNFTPLESPISLTNKTLRTVTAFGGIDIHWENPTRSELGLQLMVEEGGEYIEKETYYSTAPSEKQSFRGYADTLTTFVILFNDKWGNTSDTTFFAATPLFEVEIPKPYKDMRPQIPYDNNTELRSAFAFSSLWDGLIGDNNGWVAATGGPSTSITIDLKQVAQLSRFTMWARFQSLAHIWGRDNARIIEMYGIKKLDQSKLPPADQSYWLHEWSVRNEIYPNIPADYILPEVTFEDEWQYFGKFEVTRREDVAPEDNLTLEDLAYNGHRFDLPIDVEPVRYIRLVIHEGNNYPPANNFIGMGELSFYGDNTVPQE